MMKAIILAGGNGTRLWPLSRSNYPKQFLKLHTQKKSLFQMTYNRCLKLVEPTDIFVVTTKQHQFLVRGQLEEIGCHINNENLLVEPCAKNTLPAIYYAVQEIQKHGEDTIMVMPSDHLIKDEDSLVNSIESGLKLSNDYIVTFGVLPTSPHTGYGYIEPGIPIHDGYIVNKFIEKPDLEMAQFYMENGFLWNSGMCMFRTNLFCQELERYNKDVFKSFQRESIAEKYKNTPSVSIDYGLLELSVRVAVIPIKSNWSDLGSFDSLYEQFVKDDNGNVTFYEEMLVDSANNLIYTDKSKAVAVIGVDDLIIVDEKDALLICKKEQSQAVKEIVGRLTEKNDDRVHHHQTNYRPWGSYTILEEGFFYKIKKITVLPQKKLSYQLHHHRSEHWVVVKGTAKVTIEEEEILVRNGESTYVKAGHKHRLENPGKVLLEVIEVQLGEYLEEDDIIRIKDDFGREKE